MEPPGKGRDAAAVAAEDVGDVSAFGVPYFDGAVCGTGGEECCVAPWDGRRYGQGEDGRLMCLCAGELSCEC